MKSSNKVKAVKARLAYETAQLEQDLLKVVSLDKSFKVSFNYVLKEDGLFYFLVENLQTGEMSAALNIDAILKNAYKNWAVQELRKFNLKTQLEKELEELNSDSVTLKWYIDIRTEVITSFPTDALTRISNFKYLAKTVGNEIVDFIELGWR